MNKAKIKWTLKRFSYILILLKSGKTEATFYISKRKEKIIIDDEVKAIIEIIDEIIEWEKEAWLKDFFVQVRKGNKDIRILIDSPLEKGKYYQTKERFINKIYQCCIYKGWVSYEDIMNENIG